MVSSVIISTKQAVKDLLVLFHNYMTEVLVWKEKGKAMAEEIQTLGGLVKQRRELLNMTQTILAEEAKTSRGYIAQIEAYGLIPSKAVCIRLAHALGVNRDELLRVAGHLPRNTPAALEPEEWRLIGIYRKSSPQVRAYMLAAWNAVLAIQEEEFKARRKAVTQEEAGTQNAKARAKTKAKEPTQEPTVVSSI